MGGAPRTMRIYMYGTQLKRTPSIETCVWGRGGEVTHLLRLRMGWVPLLLIRGVGMMILISPKNHITLLWHTAKDLVTNSRRFIVP